MLAAATLGPAFLAACSQDGDPAVAPPTGPSASPSAGPVQAVSVAEATDRAQVLNTDVLDFALASDDWAGDFGFVDLRLRAGHFDGIPVGYIQTDASDEAHASANGLVFVPRIASLNTTDLAGEAFLFDDGAAGQGAVFSSAPGQPDYTPAWRLRTVRWTSDPRVLGSVAELRAAEADGDVTISETSIVLNLGIVQWGDEHMAVDAELTDYLGGGQLMAAPDVANGVVRFKLNQCYPGSWYFPLDHSLEGPAGMTSTVFSPRLQDGPTAAGATSRTNVFMGGLDGPGPMGGQPSVFDFAAGDPAWSPFWDHYTYEWASGATPAHLGTQAELWAARDRGELIEHPGAPMTAGTVFTVNCPVPIVAPNTWSPA